MTLDDIKSFKEYIQTGIVISEDDATAAEQPQDQSTPSNDNAIQQTNDLKTQKISAMKTVKEFGPEISGTPQEQLAKCAAQLRIIEATYKSLLSMVAAQKLTTTDAKYNIDPNNKASFERGSDSAVLPPAKVINVSLTEVFNSFTNELLNAYKSFNSTEEKAAKIDNAKNTPFFLKKKDTLKNLAAEDCEEEETIDEAFSPRRLVSTKYDLAVSRGSAYSPENILTTLKKFSNKNTGVIDTEKGKSSSYAINTEFINKMKASYLDDINGIIRRSSREIKSQIDAAWRTLGIYAKSTRTIASESSYLTKVRYAVSQAKSNLLALANNINSAIATSQRALNTILIDLNVANRKNSEIANGLNADIVKEKAQKELARRERVAAKTADVKDAAAEKIADIKDAVSSKADEISSKLDDKLADIKEKKSLFKAEKERARLSNADFINKTSEYFLKYLATTKNLDAVHAAAKKLADNFDKDKEIEYKVRALYSLYNMMLSDPDKIRSAVYATFNRDDKKNKLAKKAWDRFGRKAISPEELLDSILNPEVAPSEEGVDDMKDDGVAQAEKANAAVNFDSDKDETAPEEETPKNIFDYAKLKAKRNAQ